MSGSKTERRDMAHASAFKRAELEARDARLAKYAREGQTPVQISLRTGLSLDVVRRVLLRAGISYKQSTPHDREGQ
jgi:transposase